MPQASAKIPFLIALLAIPFLADEAWARHEGGAKVDRRTREQAEQLRSDGAAALATKDLEAAKQALYQSYQRNPVSETLYFLGLLAAAEGRAIEAQDLLRRFLREAAETVEPAQQKEAQRILAQPTPPFGELDIQGERGALVSVDGRLLGVLPLSQPLILAGGVRSVQLGQGTRKLDGPVDIRIGRASQLRFDMRTGVAVVTLPPTVLLVESYQGAPPAVQAALGLAAEQAIRSEQLAVLRAQAALFRAPELAPCLATHACQEQLVQRNELDFALQLLLAPQPDGAGFVLQGQLIDGPTGEAIAAASSPFELTKPEPPAAAAAALVARLLQDGRSRQRGSLEVLSTPPGAEVVIADRVAGTTPYQRAAFVGPHQITIQKVDYQPARMAVQIEPEKKATVQVLLTPLDTGSKSPPKRPLWRTITGAIAIGVGGLAFGIGALGLFQSQDRAESIAGTVVGGALVAGGVVLLVLPTRPAAAAK